MLPEVSLVRADSMPLRAKEESFHIDTFFERANRLAMPDVIRLAERFPEGSDTAIALYSIATGRYRQDLDELSKQYCVLGWMKMGDAWYRQGDYTQAFSNYGQALRVCETLLDNEYLPDIYLKIGSVIVLSSITRQASIIMKRLTNGAGSIPGRGGITAS